MVASSCAGVFGYFELDSATVLSGAAGSICVLIDGVHPGGRLRNVHIRAVHDLRQLQREIKSKLRYTVPERLSWEQLAKEMFDLVQSERRRIGGYLRDAESALGET